MGEIVGGIQLYLAQRKKKIAKFESKMFIPLGGGYGIQRNSIKFPYSFNVNKFRKILE